MDLAADNQAEDLEQQLAAALSVRSVEALSAPASLSAGRGARNASIDVACVPLRAATGE